MNLPDGVYDQLIDSELISTIEELQEQGKIARLSPLEKEFLPDYLTRSLKNHILHSLKSLKHTDKQYDLANFLLQSLLMKSADDSIPDLRMLGKNHVISEIADKDVESVGKPQIPLSMSSLFTGSNGSPQLGKELELEFESADRIDFLVSFIKNSGLNLIYPALKKFTERGGLLRVITTTYMGASDATAIEKLRTLPNTKIKISYDTRSSRLHAKAYFVHRNSGASSAYIGSANLSRAAMTSGLEWTTKISKLELPDLFRRCEATFDNYWESPSFMDYEEGDFSTFVKAIKNETHEVTGNTNLALFELKPRDYQQAVLDSLEHARSVKKHFRNLVVAATGTGKTLIAAFDYKRQCKKGEPRPKLLFLVHRKEILDQALQSFRQVLGDGNFGELLVDGKIPVDYQHVFSSVASFNSKKLFDQYPKNHWDIVILDEAHHAEASSYRVIVEEFEPEILLGLTATPERGDGVSITKDFDYPMAAEIRLPDALDKKLLCPFHYYAVSDNIDYSAISWSRGRYDQKALDEILTGNDSRVQLIINKVIEYLPSPIQQGEFDRDYVTGLGFCVSKAHAKYMAESFNKAGISSASIDSDTPNEDRNRYREQLKSGELNFIFVVDLFNEGVDIPSVNTILFLRPTESHVIYLQQFGRGLRRTDDEKHLTVLDFIGESRKEFRFDLRLSALLPGKRNDLKKEIEHGFPHLPAGCYINFEKQAKERIFNNIRQTYLNIDLRIKESFSQWKGGSAPSFYEFIRSTEENPLTLLMKRTWSDWKELAGFEVKANHETVTPELNAYARLSLVNSSSYLRLMTNVLTEVEIESYLSDNYLQAFYQLIWNKKGEHYGFQTLKESMDVLRSNERAKSDLLEIIEYAQTLADAELSPELPFACPLELHGRYTRQEIFASFGKATHLAPSSNREGVMHLKDIDASLHLVTFKKTDKFFSETTSYRDYPISKKRIHWESQSNTSRTSPVGKKYLSQPDKDYTVLLFARHENLVGKLVSPLTYLGPAKLISAKGDKPIEMVWELEHEMPYDFYIEAKRAAGV